MLKSITGRKIDYWLNLARSFVVGRFPHYLENFTLCEYKSVVIVTLHPTT